MPTTNPQKKVVATVRLLPELRPDFCCNNCQPKAQALSDWLQLALMARNRDALLADFQSKARVFYDPDF